MSAYATGFEPVYNAESRVLILGSFPSVKSRQTNFYYGNPQNRFWKMLCDYFGEEIPPTVDEKRAFVLRHKIALWDVITSCEIEGSADSSIKNEVVADVNFLLKNTRLSAVLLNGNKAYSLFEKYCPEYLTMATKLSSTSPANPRYSYEAWKNALDKVFKEKI